MTVITAYAKHIAAISAIHFQYHCHLCFLFVNDIYIIIAVIVLHTSLGGEAILNYVKLKMPSPPPSTEQKNERIAYFCLEWQSRIY